MKFIHFKELDSTQKYAKLYCKKKELIEPVAIYTDKQNNGMGRMNRKWFSPENAGVYVTYVIPEPDIRIPYQFKISVAIADFFEKEFNRIIKLKWPNDLFYKTKKVGGILIDQIFFGNKFKYILIGIGINLKKYKNKLPNELLNIYQCLDIDDFNKKKLIQMIFEYIIKKNTDNIIQEYKNKSCIMNKEIEFIDCEKKIYKGKVIDFTDEGKIVMSVNNTKKYFLNALKVNIC